jgi:hypothetical protein
MFAQGKGNCFTTEKFHARNTKCSAHYHQEVHNLEDGNSRQAIAGDILYQAPCVY